MKLTYTKKLRYEGFQYGSGDIAITDGSNVLNLYELVDSNRDMKNFVPKINSFQKGNIFNKCSR
jgi:hypothetical protein